MEWLQVLLVAALVSLLTVQINASTCTNSANSDACSWAATTNKKKYSFNLATPIKSFPHGILSEDGFYKVTTKSSEGEAVTYWFQLCEHMKFNFNPPLCENCEACGGAEHCGETCSAIMSSAYPGYSVCTTLGFPGNVNYSLIDQNKPEQGIRVTMTSCSQKSKPDCSFSVLVQCSHSGVQIPTTVTNKTAGGCDYETILRHPAGCPVVTNVSKGGWGWFGTLLFLLVLAFVVYMAVGIGYRVTVLGVSGIEAIPNLDTWRSLPSKIQLFVEYIVAQCMGVYYRFTENSYTRVNS
jgi:hypothetical protein